MTNLAEAVWLEGNFRYHQNRSTRRNALTRSQYLDFGYSALPVAGATS